MTKQLNIRSDEAVRLARRLAKQRGQTVTAVVLEALRQEVGRKPSEVQPKDAAETVRLLMEASERAAKAAKPGTSSDHSYLYDEHGLPK